VFVLGSKRPSKLGPPSTTTTNHGGRLSAHFSEIHSKPSLRSAFENFVRSSQRSRGKLTRSVEGPTPFTSHLRDARSLPYCSILPLSRASIGKTQNTMRATAHSCSLIKSKSIIRFFTTEGRRSLSKLITFCYFPITFVYIRPLLHRFTAFPVALVFVLGYA
jgi:hypothetical protein